jgi:antagonist of KipI
MSIDALEVLDAAPLATVQDLGRYGYQRYGVPVSGAMDPFALRVANLLVGNDERLAGLELTLAGPTLRVLLDTVVAVAGADLRASVDAALLPMWEAVPVRHGSTIAFRGRRSGARAYLAIAGGIDVPVVLGSRSTFVRSRLGGFQGRPLQSGDLLPVPADAVRLVARRMPRRHVPAHASRQVLRVLLGPQDDAFAPEVMRQFLTSVYVISDKADRMGYRLEGPKLLQRNGADIVSDGTPAGAVQVTGDGLPILLLADRGTAGGYTKIATVVSADLARLGQMAPGDEIRFAAVTETDAHAALREQDAIVREVATSRPRVFGRRRFTLTARGARYSALGGFEEMPDDAAGEQPIQVVIEGRTYDVQREWARQAAPDVAGDRGAATPWDRQAAAALAAAIAVATDPVPQDFPIVI